MKLKTIQLTDVLSHVDSRVGVADYLTVFTGVSDSGPTELLHVLVRRHRLAPKRQRRPF